MYARLHDSYSSHSLILKEVFNVFDQDKYKELTFPFVYEVQIKQYYKEKFLNIYKICSYLEGFDADLFHEHATYVCSSANRSKTKKELMNQYLSIFTEGVRAPLGTHFASIYVTNIDHMKVSFHPHFWIRDFILGDYSYKIVGPLEFDSEIELEILNRGIEYDFNSYIK